MMIHSPPECCNETNEKEYLVAALLESAAIRQYCAAPFSVVARISKGIYKNAIHASLFLGGGALVALASCVTIVQRRNAQFASGQHRHTDRRLSITALFLATYLWNQSSIWNL